MIDQNEVKYAVLMGRPVTSLLIAASTFFPFYFGTDKQVIVPLVAACAMFCSGMFAFIIDDVLGFTKDRDGRRIDKILVGGKSSMEMAKMSGTAFFLLSLLLASLLGVTSLVMVGFLLFLLLIYPVFSASYPAFKGAFVAILCTYPALLVNVAQSSMVVPLGAIVIAATFFFFRELAIDSTEIDTDAAAHSQTIPVRFQGFNFYRLSWLAMIGCYSALFAIETSGIRIVFTGLVILVVCATLSKSSPMMALSLSRIPILLGVVAAIS